MAALTSTLQHLNTSTHYDYIIIGAGTAGCILANRLSADGSKTVLLVEAGGRDSSPLINIPQAYLKHHHSKIDWNCYWTTPQPALNNRKIYQPRGKVLGGCSSTNAMAYIRGQHEDYDGWEALGNKGWSYKDILPFFKVSEHNEQFVNEFHGQSGPMNVTQASWYQTPLAAAFIKACIEKGIPYNDDVNGMQQEGAGWFQYTMKNAERFSAARAFLNPAIQRKNLTVLTSILVQKIILKNDRATGIVYSTGGATLSEASAASEIIICAGTFESPKLLMHSGIGDKDELNHFGIESKINLPGVGKNLQDHIFFPVGALSNTRSNNYYLPLHRQAIALLQYLITKKGSFSIGPLEAVAFLKSDVNLTRPDLQFQFTPTNPGDDKVADMYDINTLPKSDGYAIFPTQVRPLSKGTVKLQSKDLSIPLQIDPRYLSAEEDLKILIAGGRKAREVLEAEAFASVRIRNHIPSKTDSDDVWINHIRISAECVYHPVGTCKMGIDEMAVVTPTLMVKGLSNLRIADASIMPQITSGNTNAPTMMIAEKAAHMILENASSFGF